MKVFAYNSATKYGTMVHIVVADTREEADTLVKGKVWPKYLEVKELDLTTKGIVYYAYCSG